MAALSSDFVERKNESVVAIDKLNKRRWWKKIPELLKRNFSLPRKQEVRATTGKVVEEKLKCSTLSEAVTTSYGSKMEIQQQINSDLCIVIREKENLTRKMRRVEAQIEVLKKAENDWKKWYKKGKREIKIREKEIKKQKSSDRERILEELKVEKELLKNMEDDDKKRNKEEKKMLKIRRKEIKKEIGLLKRTTRY